MPGLERGQVLRIISILNERGSVTRQCHETFGHFFSSNKSTLSLDKFSITVWHVKAFFRRDILCSVWLLAVSYCKESDSTECDAAQSLTLHWSLVTLSKAICMGCLPKIRIYCAKFYPQIINYSFINLLFSSISQFFHEFEVLSLSLAVFLLFFFMKY